MAGARTAVSGAGANAPERVAGQRVRVRLSLAPLALFVAAIVTLAAGRAHAREPWTETLSVWAALFGLAFVPWYLVLPVRFAGFREQCIKRYYQSPLARSGRASSQDA